mmetsp:Transcript_60687/g.188157  ORF Transcript_60687/g.188157 Transcript_60687/m.188157 type:complete len:215 (+) Transcript_60687:918-1562(+)
MQARPARRGAAAGGPRGAAGSGGLLRLVSASCGNGALFTETGNKRSHGVFGRQLVLGHGACLAVELLVHAPSPLRRGLAGRCHRGHERLQLYGLGHQRRAVEGPSLVGYCLHARVAGLAVGGPGQDASKALLRLLDDVHRFHVAAGAREQPPQVEACAGSLDGQSWVCMLAALAHLHGALHLPDGPRGLFSPSLPHRQRSALCHGAQQLAEAVV